MSKVLRPLACVLPAFFSTPVLAQGSTPPDLAMRYEIEVTIQDQELIETVTLHLRPDKLPKQLQLELSGTMKVKSVKHGQQDLHHLAKGSRLFVDTTGIKALEKKPLKITFQVRGRPHNKFSKRHGGYLRTCVTPEITYIRSQYAWYPRVAGDPATHQITVDAQGSWLVRTAGTQTTTKTSNGRTRWTFVQDTPIGDVGLVAGPWKRSVVMAKGCELDAFVFERHGAGAKPLLRMAQEAADFYAGRFGKVPTSRFTLVEMPAAFGRSSGYGESGYVLIGEGAFQAAGEAPWVTSLVAHEVSHTWWGQQVRFTNFANESLACYSTLKFLERDEKGKAERRRAVQAYLEAAATGKNATMSEIQGWGGGMDPVAYRVHAYEKGMMLLVMVAKAVGEEKVQRALAKLFQDQTGKAIDYRTLRQTIASINRRARDIMDKWDGPGVPKLELQYEIGGRKTEIVGTLTQTGTDRPRPMAVDVVADCDGKRVTKTIWLRGANQKFRLRVPGRPKAVLLDPDYYVLAARPSVGPDPQKVIEAAMRVVNSPKQDNPKLLNGTITQLENLLLGDPGKYEGLCHTGIGRCRFRMGKFAEARTAFGRALALGAGGPFHRAWIYLRLGNMADVEGKRDEAKKLYRQAIKQGARYHAARRAEGYLDKRYPGYGTDK